MRRYLFAAFAVLSLTAACDDKVDWDGLEPLPPVVDPPIVEPFPEDWIGGMCGALYGNPTASSGLTEDQCQPSCNCSALEYEAIDYTEDNLARLDRLVLLSGPDELTYNPYETPELFPLQESAVCAILLDEEVEDGYHLRTFESEQEALDAGGIVTHTGGCGLCSSMRDLLVYIRQPDLTNPVRQCAFKALSEGEEASQACLAELGFSDGCGEIWYYNTVNTREKCIGVCLTRMNDPHHLPNGSLNPCIQCDEDESGPVFKAVSGRTRRNSGLPVALCRPCDQVRSLDHRYDLP